MTTPAEDASPAAPSPFFQPFVPTAPASASVELAREGLAACACGWSALAELAAQSRSFFDPMTYLDAQMRFWAHLADLGAEAAAERLRSAGVKAPLLND